MSGPQLKQYDSHKDSGVPWLGVIPADWSVIRLKDVGKSVIGLTYAPEDVLDDDTGTLVLRSSNIQQGQLSLLDNVYVAKKIPKNLTLRIGDILICSRNGSRNLIGKNITIDDRTVGQTFGAFMTVYRSKYSNFLRYFFNSQIFESQSGLFMSSTINQLTSNTLNNFSFVLPTTDEQTFIAAYLDIKTTQIDREIDLLAQKATQYSKLKQSLINETVTGGLDKSVPMKDSGVAWIGEVPAHWKVERVKNYVSFKKGKTPITFTDDPSCLPYLSMDFLRERDKIVNYVMPQESLVVINDGELLVLWDGANAGEIMIGKKGCLSSTMAVVKAKKSFFDESFFYFFLKALESRFKDFSNGTTIPHFSPAVLLSDSFGIPPLSEQSVIAAYLDVKTKSIDRIVTAINTQIDKLKDLRKALINDVVTGKIKVVSEGLAV